MKLTKSQLKELIRHSIGSIVSEEDVMDKKIKYKDAEGNEKEGTIGGILKKGEDHPAHKKAKSIADKSKEKKPKITKKTKISADPFGDKDKPPFKGGKPEKDDDDEYDVGGPSYPKVPKGVKTSADAKGVMKAKDLSKQAMDKGEVKTPQPSDFDGDMDKYLDALNQHMKDVESKVEKQKAKKLSKIEKEMDSAVDDANARLDALEKELKNKKESVKESKPKRFTVKEVQKWMKTLEENRYKRVYNADCRRVSWMANNMNEDIANMPKSMSKKWTKAQYGRERYLAKEFLKSKLDKLKEQLNEQKLRKAIREILKEQLILNEYTGAGKPIPRNKAKHLFVPENQMIRFSRVFKKLIQKGLVYIGDQSKEKKKITKHYTITVDKKMYNNLLDVLMSKNFKVKT